MKRILCLAAALLLISAPAFAWTRASANYRVGPDGVTAGGGRSVSASNTAPQQAVGETAGLAASASYRNRAGVVQPIPATQGGPSGWQAF